MGKGLSIKAMRGFTLVEVLIVVVILGILAAVVVPQFSDASAEAKISVSRHDLSVMRRQIDYYKSREGAWPASLNAMLAQGYVREIPPEPFGGSWNYNPGTGVLNSSTDPNW